MTLRFLWPAPVLLLLAALFAGLLIAAALQSPPGKRLHWLRLGIACVLILGIGATPARQVGETMPVSNVEVYLVIDQTGSMVAEDYDGGKPRLDGVKADVEAILTGIPQARYSVISFDNEARQDLPLTSDARAVRSWLQTLSPKPTAQAAGSSLAMAEPVLSQALARSSQTRPDSLRVVFWFSDGEETSADKGLGAWSLLSDALSGGAVLGYGTEAGGRMRSVVLDDEGEWRATGPYVQYQGAEARSKIDEGNLQRVAQDVGVEYLHREKPGGLNDLLGKLEGKASALTEKNAAQPVYRDLTWPLVWALIGVLSWEFFELAVRARRLRSTRAI